MRSNETEAAHGTLRGEGESSGVRRSMTIRKPMEDVRSAWKGASLPGTPSFRQALGDRGIEIHVAVEDNDEVKHLLSPYKGEGLGGQLDEALRAFKARVETGEVPTITGQPSGRA
ncbi:MAG: hypothetical protein H0U59_12165 [Gemmatimonadaceae bacterium]|nr:hypothetical protein [Gemmatimonadaceae bacterium]